MDDDKKIVSLAKRAGTGVHRGVEELLLDALKAVRGGSLSEYNKKAMILFLNESDDEYNVSWMQSGMRMSQCLSLCEVGKVTIMSEMGYIKSGMSVESVEDDE